MDGFDVKHDNGRLIVTVEINGNTYEKGVAEHFENDNTHDDWLDFRLGI